MTPKLTELIRDRWHSVPAVPRLLGLAGLLPQLAAVLALFVLPRDAGYFAQALAFAYAALILSFLGGLWWGLAAGARAAPAWVYGAAVVPSLYALACAVPWALTMLSWPGPSLIALALGLFASLWVDVRFEALALNPRWWLALRVPLSLGFGTLTLLAGLAR